MFLAVKGQKGHYQNVVAQMPQDLAVKLPPTAIKIQEMLESNVIYQHAKHHQR